MNYKKIETTVRPNGTVGQKNLGWASNEHLDADKSRERERASRLAQSGVGIISVEETENTIVVIYVNGKVKILAYVLEDK